MKGGNKTLKKWVVATAILVGFCLVYFLWPKSDGLPVLNKINDFQLKTVSGEEYNFDNEKIKVVTFFYTHCPDVCPLTMYDMKALQSELKKNSLFGKQVELVSITLDPEMDTVAIITDYAQAFEADFDGWIWLRGSVKETKAITKDFDMLYQKMDGGSVTHTTKLYLVDEEQQILGKYKMANNKKRVNIDKIISDILSLSEQ